MYVLDIFHTNFHINNLDTTNIYVARVATMFFFLIITWENQRDNQLGN